jgi:hypothetical protein
MATSGYWYENGLLHMTQAYVALTNIDWVTDVTAGNVKVILSDTAPTYTHAHYSDVSAAELAAGGGYAVLTKALATPTAALVTDTTRYLRFDADDVAWTGFSAGPFRYMEVLKDTATASTSPLLCWHDMGAETTGGGGTFTYQFSVLGGVCRISIPHP